MRVFSGVLTEGQSVKFWSSGGMYKVEETGIFRLVLQKKEKIEAGEVGYFIANIKTISDIRVGDTVTDEKRPCSVPLTGFKEVKPVVFSSIYPVISDDYDELYASLEKLKLNDASLVDEKDSSAALVLVFAADFWVFYILKLYRKGLKGNSVFQLCLLPHL